MSGLRVTDLRVEIDGHRIIDGLSFEVGFGELLVITGPSGSGKSTLLRALSGLAPIAGGRIELGGRRIDALPPGDRETAMMFQSDALYPHLSVLDNLCFGLRARGVGRDQAHAQATEIAERLDLGSLLQRLPGALSGGQRQRVALGRALLRSPRMFLMDEPLSSLDAPLRVRARAELIQLHRALGSVTIYVTHDQIEAMALADRLGVLEHGRLLQLDVPRTVYQRPASLAVARFLGAPAINLLALARDGGACTWNGLTLPLQLPAGVARAVLGLRPEHLFPRDSRWARRPQRSFAVAARVEAVELAGDQQYLALRSGDDALTSRCEPDLAVQAGDLVELVADLDEAVLFDADSGRVLSA